jgi:hypothetical protein
VAHIQGELRQARLHIAYVIDIHGDWTRDHLLEVLAGEWPRKGVIHEIKGAPSASQITESQRANLRKNGYNAAFTFGGKVFMPASIMMSGGTTRMAWAWARHLLGKIAALEQALATNPRCLAPDFQRYGLAFPDTPEFEFAIREDGAGVMEKKAGAWMKLTVNQ